MIKHGKKNNYQLKFQISKGNLDCFMKKKSMSLYEGDKNDKRRKNSRGKPKSTLKKVDVFHQQKFISSIIKNAMTQQFTDPKQVTEMVHKMNIYNEQNHESPTNEDDILKSFEIFKDPINRLTPEIKCFPVAMSQSLLEKQGQENKELGSVSEMQISLGKECEWKNFSTQIETEVGTQRSRQDGTVEMYPSLLPQQYYLPINPVMGYQIDGTFFSGLSKEQRQRKSTPIRGQNEQFRIKLDKVQLDGRTTVMIRHIPNKYTQEMLIDEINQNHRLKYNFFYLPVDSYNPCNVGYAFINFIDAKFISKFYLEFNGKRWNKFNSEKICELAYARIQGSKALISHFQNSNVMHSRDKRFRPFISFGEGYSSGK